MELLTHLRHTFKYATRASISIRIHDVRNKVNKAIDMKTYKLSESNQAF